MYSGGDGEEYRGRDVRARPSQTTIEVADQTGERETYVQLPPFHVDLQCDG